MMNIASPRLRLRVRQVPVLVPGTIRAVPWGPLLGGAALALAMVHFGSRDPGSLMLHLRLGAVLLCAGAAYVVDDPAARTLAYSPTPLLGRRAFRVTGAVVVAGATWGALLVDVRGAAGPGGWPPASLTLQAAALLAAALSMAVLASRVAPDGRGGVAGSAAVLVLALVSVALPGRWSPFPFAEMGWSNRPAVLLAGGMVAFLWASLDPARRSAPWWRPRRSNRAT
jgi:hypothetical protein